MNAVRKLLKWPLREALRLAPFRQRVAFELRQDYFEDFEISIPLTAGMCCPIRRRDYVHSFSEIFLGGEYGDFLEHMPLPRRWIDLGCHAGYFSLYLAWQWRAKGGSDFSALLVDADPRVASDVEYLVRANNLERQFKFCPGVIKAGTGEVRFGLREGMVSSFSTETKSADVANVPVLSSSAIREIFPGSFDLLKVDIEGAEFEFIEHYTEVLARARQVIVEWHSWDEERSGEAKLRDLMAKEEFDFVLTIQPRKQHIIDGKALSTGCHLYRNAK